ncbi:MAG: hypothetical protein Q9164_000509 [Protoblastenia rupestris]
MVKIFDDGSISEQGGWGNAELGKGLLPIWAILLRFYAVNDIVAFLSIAAMPNDLPKDVTKDAKSKVASQYSRIHMCYDIPDHIRSCDVKVASKASHKSGEKDATVNTAVAFSKPPSSDTAELASVIRDLLAERINVKYMIKSFSINGERHVGQLDFVSETDKQLMRGWNPTNPFT